MEQLAHAVLIGAGATLVMDVGSVLRHRFLGTRLPDYCLVGRWISHLPRGRFHHHPIASTPAVRHECVIGWVSHYAIGVVFAGLLLAVWGFDWARHPTIGPALAIGIVTVAAPFFLMQPGMGAGVAASRTPRPNAARLQSLITHTTFGVGLYAAALFVNFLKG